MGVDESPDRSQGTYDEMYKEEVSQDDVDQPSANQHRTPRFNFPRPNPMTQGQTRSNAASSTPSFTQTRVASTPEASSDPASIPSTSSRNMGPPGFTLTDDQFKLWMQFQASQQKTTNEPIVPAPCVGGTNRQGYWMGFGLMVTGPSQELLIACMNSFITASISSTQLATYSNAKLV